MNISTTEHLVAAHGGNGSGPTVRVPVEWVTRRTAVRNRHAAEAQRLRERGTPVVAIAEQLGVEPRSVHRYLQAPAASSFVDDELAEEGWKALAVCAQTDPEAFFPDKGGSTKEAKKICQGCEVISECLNSALKNDERFGVWGGLSERERRQLKRRNSAA